MKTYKYYEHFAENASFITEQEIIDQYWDYWLDKMLIKYDHKSELITLDNCILDWCSIHWADEVIE